MRGLRIENRRRGRPVTLRVNGRPLRAFAGESLLAALFAAGILVLRPAAGEKGPGRGRGAFCGMGVCQECRVTIDGMADRRACMTEVAEGMEVVLESR